MVECSVERARSEKRTYLVLEMRDDAFRPTIGSLADVRNKIDELGIPMGEIRGYATQQFHMGGQRGSLCGVQYETASEIIDIAIPFSSAFKGIDVSGRERKFGIEQFDGSRINPDGSVVLGYGLELRRVKFVYCRLPLEWSVTSRNISRILIRYVNETGLAARALGRELPTWYVDYASLALVAVADLRKVELFIRARWRVVHPDSKPPSRETIAATLAALSMRQRSRGRNADA